MVINIAYNIELLLWIILWKLLNAFRDIFLYVYFRICIDCIKTPTKIKRIINFWALWNVQKRHPESQKMNKIEIFAHKINIETRRIKEAVRRTLVLHDKTTLSGWYKCALQLWKVLFLKKTTLKFNYDDFSMAFSWFFNNICLLLTLQSHTRLHHVLLTKHSTI